MKKLSFIIFDLYEAMKHKQYVSKRVKLLVAFGMATLLN